MSKKKVRALPESLGLPCLGVDTHAHVDSRGNDIPAVLERAAACGVRTVGNVFLGPAAYRAERALFDALPDVFFLLGVHPHDAAKMTEADLAAMRHAFTSDSRLRALGEIGLDFYYDYSPPDIQETWFRRQLELARELDLPVAVHCREAEEQCLRVLDDMGWAGRPLLWHCFGLGPEWVEPLISRGWFISVPGTVTYAKSEALRQAVPHIPAERLVLETDAPYLAPEPYRGKHNEPALLGFTAVEVARVRGEDVRALWTRCAENARRFFGLP